jgi:mono/diheme cytochrome c family protein
MDRNLLPLLIAAAVLLVLTVPGSLSGKALKSTADKVYTEAQALRGAQVYKDHCSECHLEDLSGNWAEDIPSLAGEDFEKFWRGQPLGDIYKRISKDMPDKKPGSLEAGQYADVLAFILSKMNEPAGTVELKPDPGELGAVIIAPAR